MAEPIELALCIALYGGATYLVVYLVGHFAHPASDYLVRNSEKIAEEVSDIMRQCEDVVERAFQEPLPEPPLQPTPWLKGDPFIPPPPVPPTPTPGPTRRLYHGTQLAAAESILNVIDMAKQIPLSDFGQGFYTTASFEDAKRLAIRRNDRGGNKPVVIQFDVPISELNALSHNIFYSADDEWKAFVYYHRHTPGVGHEYDWVEGPVAYTYDKPDNVTAFEYPKFHQLSIHTPIAFRLFEKSITDIIFLYP